MTHLEVIHAERTSPVLAPSSLRCVAHQPTVNVTQGCLHRCAYCYARGYRVYPGDGRVVVYTNTVERLKAELDRRRRPPDCVYFSPASDAFQDIPEVLDQTYGAMEVLLRRHIPVSFLTKGRVPSEFFDLFARHARWVHGQIDMTTLDEEVQTLLEPFAAPPSQRLLDLRRLVRSGVRAEARLDPLIPGLTDRPREVRRLLAAIAAMGVKSVAVNYLVLRRAIRENLYRDLRGRVDLGDLFRLYRGGTYLPLRGHEALVQALPREYRQRTYDLVRQAAQDFGLVAHICGCKNADLSEDSCNVSGRDLVSAAEPSLFAWSRTPADGPWERGGTSWETRSVTGN
jgi:DNA repair photolyase